MLSLENACVSIGGVRVLRNVSFTLEAGSTTVLVGRNGAGKTTTLRAIMGLLPLDEGKVDFDGTALNGMAPHIRARLNIGYAPENRDLVSEFSVEENILLPAYALNLSASARKTKLESIYELLPGVHTMRERSGGNVSGGQGKMVALARALMAGSRVILLDEPLQGLAPALALEYARALERMRKHYPQLCVMITESSPQLLKQIEDKRLYIERGAVQDAQV